MHVSLPLVPRDFPLVAITVIECNEYFTQITALGKTGTKTVDFASPVNRQSATQMELEWDPAAENVDFITTVRNQVSTIDIQKIAMIVVNFVLFSSFVYRQCKR